MAKRKEHLFRFTGKEIADAAVLEAAYRWDRVDHWQVEHEAAIAAAEGAMATIQRIPATGGDQVRLGIDMTLADRINTAEWKRANHRQAADRYLIDAATYGSNPKANFELDGDDVMYFRLGGGAREE